MSEELEQVRGVLTALASRGNALLQPVSTNAVSAALVRRNRPLDARKCLDRLTQVGDAQRLHGGLWVPCSTTLVRCADLLIVSSGLPTPRLATEFGVDLMTVGDSRALVRTSISNSDIRLRNFETWCRAPVSSRRWAEVLLENARYWRASPVEGMEWHDHWTAGNLRRWSDLRADIELPRGPALARLKGRHGFFQYLLLSRDGAGLVMAEVSKKEGTHQRLRYALLAASGNSATFRSTSSADGFREVGVPRILPAPELMVLTALGNVLSPPDAWEQVFRIPEFAWPQIEKMLMGLGLARSEAA